MAYVSEAGLSWALQELKAYRSEGGRDLRTMFLILALKRFGVTEAGGPVVVRVPDFDDLCQQILQVVHDGDPTSAFGAQLYNVFGAPANPLVATDWGRSTLFTRGYTNVGWKKVIESTKVGDERDWRFLPGHVAACEARLPRQMPVLALACFLFRRPSDAQMPEIVDVDELIGRFMSWFGLTDDDLPLLDISIPAGFPGLGQEELTRAQVIELVAAAEPGCPLADRLAAESGGVGGDIANEVVACAHRMGQVLLFGPPGTGKSHWALQAASRMVGHPGQVGDALASGRARLVAWHPSWTYEDFVRRVVIEGDAVVTKPGIFQQLCLDAEASGEDHVLVLDEINRGNTVAVLGELMFALERDKRGTPVTLSDGTKLSVPDNVYVLATANTADRSIAALDVALGRRFARVEVPPDPGVLGDGVVAGVALGALLATLNRHIGELIDREHRVGHAYLLTEDGAAVSTVEDVIFAMRYRIVPLMQDYTLHDFAELEGVLGDGFVDADAQRIRTEAFASEAAFADALQRLPGLAAGHCHRRSSTSRWPRARPGRPIRSRPWRARGSTGPG